MRPQRQRRELLNHRRRMRQAEHEVRARLTKSRPGGGDRGKGEGVEVMLMVAAENKQGFHESGEGEKKMERRRKKGQFHRSQTSTRLFPPSFISSLFEVRLSYSHLRINPRINIPHLLLSSLPNRHPSHNHHSILLPFDPRSIPNLEDLQILQTPNHLPNV